MRRTTRWLFTAAVITLSASVFAHMGTNANNNGYQHPMMNGQGGQYQAMHQDPQAMQAWMEKMHSDPAAMQAWMENVHARQWADNKQGVGCPGFGFGRDQATDKQ